MKKADEVAPLVGAWIEIYPNHILYYQEYRRSSRGSVDWNNNSYKWVPDELSRSSRGSVDWNFLIFSQFFQNFRRSSRGSVDWNIIYFCAL